VPSRLIGANNWISTWHISDTRAQQLFFFNTVHFVTSLLFPLRALSAHRWIGKGEYWMNVGNFPNGSPQLHGEAIRTQEMITQALCALAQTAPHDGTAVRATQALTSVQRIIDEIVVHISQPNTLSETAAQELKEFITDLQQKTRGIQTEAGV
jgi:hypothetical protein